MSPFITRTTEFLILTAFLFALPADAGAQPSFPPGVTPEQIQFVVAAREWLTQVHAEEEGTISAAVLTASRRIGSLREDSISLQRQIPVTQRLVSERRRALPPYPQVVGFVETREQRVYRERLAALEEAEATLRTLQRNRSKLLGDLDAAHGIQSDAQARLAEARTLNAADRLELERALSEWTLASVAQGEVWIALTATITRIGAENGAEATVAFKSQPITNVTLLYQTEDERSRGATPHSVSNPTNTTGPLIVGWYHIWYERNGVPKSDRNRVYPIEKKHVAITVDIFP